MNRAGLILICRSALHRNPSILAYLALATISEALQYTPTFLDSSTLRKNFFLQLPTTGLDDAIFRSTASAF